MVGGQDDIMGINTYSYIAKLQPINEGDYDNCFSNLRHYNIWTEEGGYKDGIQEHIMVLNQGVPVMCGGIAGDFDEEQVPTGAQCYTPYQYDDTYWGKFCNFTIL